MKPSYWNQTLHQETEGVKVFFLFPQKVKSNGTVVTSIIWRSRAMVKRIMRTTLHFSRTREVYVAREPSETSRKCTSAELKFLRGSWELEVSEQKLWGWAWDKVQVQKTQQTISLTRNAPQCQKQRKAVLWMLLIWQLRYEYRGTRKRLQEQLVSQCVAVFHNLQNECKCCWRRPSNNSPLSPLVGGWAMCLSFKAWFDQSKKTWPPWQEIKKMRAGGDNRGHGVNKTFAVVR